MIFLFIVVDWNSTFVISNQINIYASYFSFAGTAHFASRVGKSLLSAVGLEAMSAPSMDKYKSMAIKIGSDRSLANKIKAALVKNRYRL